MIKGSKLLKYKLHGKLFAIINFDWLKPLYHSERSFLF